MRTGTALVEILGVDRVEAVVLECAGQREIMPCDGVIFTGKFVPEAYLPRRAGLEIDSGTGGPAIDNFFRCSDAAYFAAGNLLRSVEHSGVAAGEGAAAAGFILRALRGELPDPVKAMPVLAGGAMRYVYPQRILPDGKTDASTFAYARPHRNSIRKRGLIFWPRLRKYSQTSCRRLRSIIGAAPASPIPA